jgi:hypothetical protein
VEAPIDSGGRAKDRAKQTGRYHPSRSSRQKRAIGRLVMTKSEPIANARSTDGPAEPEKLALKSHGFFAVDRSAFRWAAVGGLKNTSTWKLPTRPQTFIQLAAAAELAKQHPGFADNRNPSRACPGPSARRNTWADSQTFEQASLGACS